MTAEGRDIGARMRALRTAQKLTQKDIAGGRYTTAFVSSIEAGRRQPSADALVYLAERLGVDAAELREGRPSTAALELRLADARQTHSKGDPATARTEIEAVLGLTTEHGLRQLRAQALVALGFWCLRAGDPRTGVEHYQEAERLLRDDPEPLRAAAVAGEARCLRILGDVRRALFVLERALEALERAGLPDPVALMLLNAQAVSVYQDLGMSSKAVTAAETALRLSPQVEDPAKRADMYRAVARGFLEGNRVGEARAAVARAQELYDQLDLRTDVGHCFWARSWTYSMHRPPNLPSARRHLEKARDIFIETGSRFDEALVTIELADVVRRLGAYDRARSLIAVVVDYPELITTPAANAEAERCLGLIAAESGDPSTAVERLERAIGLFRLAEEVIEEARTFRHLGDVRRGGGDSDGALAAYRSGLMAIDTD